MGNCCPEFNRKVNQCIWWGQTTCTAAAAATCTATSCFCCFGGAACKVPCCCAYIGLFGTWIGCSDCARSAPSGPAVRFFRNGVATTNPYLLMKMCKLVQRLRGKAELPMKSFMYYEVSSTLAKKGFTLRQACAFYSKYIRLGKITKDTTTNDIVRKVIIPETASKQCSYMDIMDGGCHVPKKLVSHWWGNSFYNDLLCMVQDALGMSGKHLEAFVAHGWEEVSPGSREDLLLEYSTFWMCIFAVNQHVSICGSSYNPCECGSKKFQSGHPLCEMDKFDSVVEEMKGGLCVALDPALRTLTRVWVVSEIGKCLDGKKPITYHLPDTDGGLQHINPDAIYVTPVALCQASLEADKTRILKQIRETVGLEVFDSQVAKQVRMGVMNRAIVQAVSASDEIMTQRLLSMNADANSRGFSGETCIELAIKNCSTAILELLLRFGAKHTRDRKGRGLLLVAAESGHRVVLQRLLSLMNRDHRVASMGGAYWRLLAMRQIPFGARIQLLWSARRSSFSILVLLMSFVLLRHVAGKLFLCPLFAALLLQCQLGYNGSVLEARPDIAQELALSAILMLWLLPFLSGLGPVTVVIHLGSIMHLFTIGSHLTCLSECAALLFIISLMIFFASAFRWLLQFVVALWASGLGPLVSMGPGPLGPWAPGHLGCIGFLAELVIIMVMILIREVLRDLHRCCSQCDCCRRRDQRRALVMEDIDLFTQQHLGFDAMW